MKQENIISHGGYLKELSLIFSSNTREKAHELSAPILRAMASDRGLLEAVIRYNLANPDFINSMRNYEKLLKFKVLENAEFNLVMNIFPPGKTNEKTTVKSIHHHQNLILSTINTFGPGYESILFKKDFHVNRSSLKATMEIDEVFFHEPGQLRFIDSFVPHVVFFPETVTATFALWSINRKRKIEYFKKNPALDMIRPAAAKTAHLIGLGNVLGLNNVSEVYFYVREHNIYMLKHKLKYPKGPNSTFLSNIFCFLKDVGFEDRDFMKKIKEDPRILPNAKLWINKFIKNEYHEFSYDEAHYMIPEENMKKSDILSAINSDYWRFTSESGMPIVNKFEAGF